MERRTEAGVGGPSRQRRRRGTGGRHSPAPKILIVDDDPDIVALLRLLMEGDGYNVITAAGPQEGMRKLDEARPDLVLLDIMMPTGTEGFHFVWNLRRHADSTLRDIPVVVLSAIHRTGELRLYPEQHDQEYAPGEFLPVQAFLDKPCGVDELARVVESVLAGVQRS